MNGNVAKVLAQIGANVRRARLRRGWTQESLAQQADFGLAYLQRIERGAANVSIPVLVALSDALRVPIGALFRKTRPLERPTGRPRKRKPENARG